MMPVLSTARQGMRSNVPGGETAGAAGSVMNILCIWFWSWTGFRYQSRIVSDPQNIMANDCGANHLDIRRLCSKLGGSPSKISFRGWRLVGNDTPRLKSICEITTVQLLIDVWWV